jgi:hypothetical protein
MINILPIWQITLLHEYYIYITIFGFSFQGFSFQVGQVSCQVTVPAVIVITENISPSRVTSNKFYNNKQKTINLTISLNMRRSVVLSPFLATIVFTRCDKVVPCLGATNLLLLLLLLLLLPVSEFWSF